MNKIIVWFRRDLRLYDNPALAWAVNQQAAVLPIYIHSPAEEAPWAPGAASHWWLHQSLQELEACLAERGLVLHYFRGNASDILPALARNENVHALAANRLFEPHMAQRDQKVFSVLSDLGIETRFFDSNLLFPPGSLLNQQGKPYRVFTPFWRKARRMLEVKTPEAAVVLPKGKLPGYQHEINDAVNLEALGLLDPHPWHKKLHQHWQPGETSALRQLDYFVESGLENYQINREIPALKGSSRLSPHLHFGEITPRQICRSLTPRLLEPDIAGSSSIECFLSELGWREFAHHVLWHFPHSSQQSMNPRFKDAFWKRDDEALDAWQSGATGIPLVDAGMQELWETGWMHNRIRMLVGSFLTKNLGIHWVSGARWFWDTLVDADLASNSLGWQWIAGCGVDAAPYYRIFNPETQARKFDPEEIYIRTWLGNRSIHRPFVDLKESRDRALARYQNMKRTI